MNLLTSIAGRPSVNGIIERNAELTDAQIYPLSLEKTITTTSQLEAVNAATMILGTTLILTINGIQTVYRLTAGTDASAPPRIIRTADYSAKNRVWKLTPVQGWAYCADNGKSYPITCRIVSGRAQPELGDPI